MNKIVKQAGIERMKKTINEPIIFSRLSEWKSELSCEAKRRRVERVTKWEKISISKLLDY